MEISNEKEMFEIMKLAENNNIDDLIKQSKNIDDLSLYLTSHGETILHLGGRNNNVKMIEYGISKKCYVNMCDYYGATPLYHASSQNSYNVVKYLIKLNADPRLISAFSGYNPCEIAKTLKIKKTLIDYTNKFEEILKNPYSNFAYRLAYELRYFFISLIHPNKHFCVGQYINLKMKQLHENNKINEMIEMCKEYDKKYEVYLLDKTEHPNINNKCLICSKNCNELCISCKKVYICNNCLHSKDEEILCKLLIHLNNEIYFS